MVKIVSDPKKCSMCGGRGEVTRIDYFLGYVTVPCPECKDIIIIDKKQRNLMIVARCTKCGSVFEMDSLYVNRENQKLMPGTTEATGQVYCPNDKCHHHVFTIKVLERDVSVTPSTPVANASEPGVTHTPAQTDSSTVATLRARSRVEERDGKVNDQEHRDVMK